MADDYLFNEIRKGETVNHDDSGIAIKYNPDNLKWTTLSRQIF